MTGVTGVTGFPEKSPREAVDKGGFPEMVVSGHTGHTDPPDDDAELPF